MCCPVAIKDKIKDKINKIKYREIEEIGKAFNRNTIPSAGESRLG